MAFNAERWALMSLLRDLENIGKRAPQTGFIFKRTSVSGGIQIWLLWADFHPLVSGNVKNKSNTAQATKKTDKANSVDCT